MSAVRRRLFLVVKALVGAAVVVAVVVHFWKLLSDPAAQERLTLRWEYLLPAGVLYVACHTLWATFWVQLLRGQGVSVPWLTGVRAYFVSQPGKYVPGKALVILLRIGLLKGTAASRTVVVVTGIYETLTNMAAGAVVGALLLPWSAPTGENAEWQRWAIIGLAFVPLVLFVLNTVVRRVAARYRRPDAPPLPVPSLWLLARGMAQSVVGWGLLGLSAWLVSCGVSADPPPLTPLTFAQHLGAMCVSYVLGFAIIFTAGGLGTREEIQQQMLAAALGAGPAAAAAVATRLVWTVAELLAVGGLWRVKVAPSTPSDPSPPTALPQGERGASVEVPA